jgi:hypothetical protein
MLNRRQAIKTTLGALGGASGAAALYAYFVEPHWVRVHQRTLPIDGLPEHLEGRTLVQLSDLHVGPDVDSRYLMRALDRAGALEPDVVVVTGDWITYRTPAELDELARVLEHAPRGRLGSVGILGNHDYGPGWRNVEIANAVAEVAGGAGIRVLRNEAATIAGLQVIGLADLWSPQFGPAELLATHGADPATLVLCHNPDGADRPVWGDYRGWILAGHTHGGQCKPPFLPPPMLPVENRRYTAGEIPLADGRRLYINRGLGHWLHVRFNVRPEITRFTLRRGPVAAEPATKGTS